MMEANCVSDLLERGIDKMHELNLAKSEGEVFEYDEGQLVGCCALGAMVLAVGGKPDPKLETYEAIRLLSKTCPGILALTEYPSNGEVDDDFLTVGDYIWNLNDGVRFTMAHRLKTIASLLRSKGY